MTTPRSRLVDPSVTRWYHCITRCVRQARLLGDGSFDRKSWLEQRITLLAEAFSIAVGGFTVLDNHLHLLVRLDPQLAFGWSDEEVARRWARVFPPRDARNQPIEPSAEWIQLKLKDPAWITKTRERLANLGWFMKCLKEPLSRMANKEDEKRGAFFEGHYKSIAILDEESLLAVCAYIDLNPVAAGVVELPEASPHTSIKTRVEHVRKKNRLGDLLPARKGNVPASRKADGLEDSLWLCPIEDRRRFGGSREGMIEGFTLGGYLLLLDQTSRLLRAEKASVDRSAAEILERIGCDAESWRSRLLVLAKPRRFGCFMAARPEILREKAKELGRRHLANVAGLSNR